MDFSAIFQTREKRYWWLDAIFYFAVSLLMAVIFCYLIFSAKVAIQKKEIASQIANLQTVGTDEQKSYEAEVLGYQKKISDFNKLLASHGFASNVFVFVEKETMPNVWFKQFNMDAKSNTVRLSGEADNMEAFSRQVAGFEKNEYIKEVGLLNSVLSKSGRVNFGISLVLEQKIFNYLELEGPDLVETTTPSE